MQKIPTLPYLALLCGGICIGFAAIFVRLADTGPVASAFWRLAIAAPFLLLAARWDTKRKGTSLPAPSRGSLLLGVLFAADLGVWHWSIHFTTVANATLLGNFAVIFVSLFAWIFWRQRQGGCFVASLILALAGTVLLTGAHFGAWGPQALGDVLGLLTALLYASYMIVLSRVRRQLDTLPLMAWSSTVSALVLLPLALISPQPFWPESAAGWSVVIGMALVTQVLGQVLIAYAFVHMAPTLSALSLLIQPVIAALAAWLIFNEALTGASLFGALLVLAGLILARLSAR